VWLTNGGKNCALAEMLKFLVQRNSMKKQKLQNVLPLLGKNFATSILSKGSTSSGDFFKTTAAMK
jgi:hypothetical protein